MITLNKDKNYYKIIKDIEKNPKFKLLKYCKHHGTTRYDHSQKVAYKSYKIAKKLNLDYVSTARGALLHDFFIEEDLSKNKQKLSMFFHPYNSLKNSRKYFKLNKKEKNIIISHMFPTLPHKIPLYKESILVSIIDKIIATEEFYQAYGKKYIYKLSTAYLLLLTFFRN